jgi:hypothetical protein
MAYLSASAVRADAVFASDLQHRDEPSAGQVRQAAVTRTVRCPVRQVRRISFLSTFASTTTGGGRSRMSAGNAPRGSGNRMGATALYLCMSATIPRTRRATSSAESNPFPTRPRLLRATAPPTD